MSYSAVRVEGVSKQFRIGDAERGYQTLRDTLVEAASYPFRRLAGQPAAEPTTIWALRDIGFDVKPGEVVGLIGRNGAGKSTLLKVLSRITEPTTGCIRIRGRVASLLEVGTGFHAELSGRENLYLNGAILGMTKREIDRKFDEIVAFAEVEKFIDTPVKRYSSGMYLRLAFAVAAHLEPEILVVDEVLAVGDAEFQKKCLGKMGEISYGGRTVLFVSHNMAAVQRLCSRALVIDSGKLVFDGEVETGIRRYIESGGASGDACVSLLEHPGRHPAALPWMRQVRLLDDDRRPTSKLVSGQRVHIEVVLDAGAPVSSPSVGIGVNDSLGTRVFSVATYLSDTEVRPIDGLATFTCTIPELPLPPGRYNLSLSAGHSLRRTLDVIENAASFDVDQGDFFGNGRAMPAGLGVVLVRSEWDAA